VDQLPDSRRAILIALKRQGSATIANLADELKLTGEAVRQQSLLQSWNDGTRFGTAAVLEGAWTYTASRIMPIAAGLAGRQRATF